MSISSLSVLLDLMNVTFEQPTKPHYWHYLARNCFNIDTYSGKKIEEMVNILGVSSLNSIAGKGWNPLHVSSIYGNPAAIEYFLGKGVSTTAQDECGKTPIDYCKEFYPKLFHLYVFPYQYTADVSPTLGPLMQGRIVPLEGSATYKKNTNDFGIEIPRLLLSKEVDGRKTTIVTGKKIVQGAIFFHTSCNMRFVAKRLGIEVQISNEAFPVRDSFLRLSNGEIKRPHLSKHAETALVRTHSSNLYLGGRTCDTLTKNPLFSHWLAKPGTHSVPANMESPSLFNNKVHQYLKYSTVDGGNVWTLTNLKGEVKVLIGRDHRTLTMHQLRLEKQPWNELAEKTLGKVFVELQKEIASMLTVEKIKKTAEIMFAEGVLLLEDQSGIIDQTFPPKILTSKFQEGSAPISPKEKHWFRAIALKMGALQKEFKWDPTNLEESRVLVAEYLAKKKITHHLMAADFGVSPQHLHFIPQAAMHLDMCLRPGPNNSVFIADYTLCGDFLKALQQDADKLGLIDQDKAHLERYILTAEKFALEFGALLKKTAEKVTKAGFTIIPMPGIFLYESAKMYQEFIYPTGGLNINFMNAVTGWSPKKNKYYYITHGLQVGDKLGERIMDSFMYFMRSYVPDIEIHFIGRNPNKLQDLSEALDWWNRLDTQAGIHCYTFELDTCEHIDKSS